MVWTLEILERPPDEFPKIMGATDTQDKALSSSDSSSKTSLLWTGRAPSLENDCHPVRPPLDWPVRLVSGRVAPIFYTSRSGLCGEWTPCKAPASLSLYRQFLS